MLGRLAHWMRARMEDGAFETKAHIPTFVLHAVLVATVTATAISLAVTAVLARFGVLAYPFADALQFSTMATVLIVSSVTALLAWLFGAAMHEMAISRAELRQLGRMDRPTGLMNRSALLEELARGDAGALVLFDIDGFAEMDARLGSAAIDRTCEELRRVFAPPHVIGRFASAQFAVLVRAAGDADCRLRVEEVRRSVSARPVAAEEGVVCVTLSAGITELAGRPVESLFGAADRMLRLAQQPPGRDMREAAEQAPRPRRVAGRGRR